MAHITIETELFESTMPVPYPTRIAGDPQLEAIYDQLVTVAELRGRALGRGDELRADRLARRGKRLLGQLRHRCRQTGGASWDEYAEIDRDLMAVQQLGNLMADQPRS